VITDSRSGLSAMTVKDETVRGNPLEPVTEPPQALRIMNQRDGVEQSRARPTVVPPARRRPAVSRREWIELAALLLMGLAAAAVPCLLFLFFSLAG